MAKRIIVDNYPDIVITFLTILVILSRLTVMIIILMDIISFAIITVKD